MEIVTLRDGSFELCGTLLRPVMSQLCTSKSFGFSCCDDVSPAKVGTEVGAEEGARGHGAGVY